MSPCVVGYLLTGSRPRGLDENWQGRGRGEGVCFALVVRDGLLECPNCGGDHFTTLRMPQKNLFSSALARLGRTGLVLTDLPAFIVASSADRQLAPALAPRPSGALMGLERSESALKITPVNQSAMAAEGASVKDASPTQHQRWQKFHQRITANYLLFVTNELAILNVQAYSFTNPQHLTLIASNCYDKLMQMTNWIFNEAIKWSQLIFLAWAHI